jgi:general secretion pathway protein G
MVNPMPTPILPTMRQRGFTLIELLVVMAIIALLASIAAPRYFGNIDKAKEAVLRENLATMRDVLDKHYADHGKYPAKLADLVSSRYLRQIPPDPITDSDRTWIVVPPPSAEMGGVFDVKSGAPGRGRDGRLYREW